MASQDSTLILPIGIVPFSEADIEPICSWVITPEQLKKISSDAGNEVTRPILEKWVDQSVDAVTIRYQNHPVGFCTLSNAENGYPQGDIELCHFVIAPQYRRRYLGTTLLNYMRVLAAERGYKALYGRVVPGNGAGLSFTNYTRWTPDYSSQLPRRFRWFAYELRSLK